MSLQKIGETRDGTAVHEATLHLPSGATASVISYGAILRDLRVPLFGSMRRVVLGYRDLDGYLANPSPMGAIAGRSANRIAGGRFRLDGVDYQLACNETGGRNHLHGGATGFSRQVWTFVDHGESFAVLELTSPDGHEGYPGTVVVRCEFRLLEPMTLYISLSAQTTAATLLNLAHHSFFTLAPGSLSRDHILQVNASSFTPVDATKIPTGEISSVDGTRYDFRAPVRIGERMGEESKLDINFVLGASGAGLPAARVWSPDRRVAMEVVTTEPGLQIYDGSNLKPSNPGLDGNSHRAFGGLCLEPQKFPDAINHASFPSSVLRPGEIYTQTTSYKFAEADRTQI